MPEGGRKSDVCGRFFTHARVDEALTALMAAQHGAANLDQLRLCGLSARAIQHRAERSRLHRIHQGVYSLVPRQLLSRHGHWMAAVLACGEGAVLSHRTAAALHELRPTQRAKVDVTIPERIRRRHDRIDIHQCTTLSEVDVVVLNNIPCTSLARTMLDLAAVIPRRPVERAFDQAEIAQVFDLVALEDVMVRNPTHKGVQIVNAILNEHYVGSTPTASEFEEAMYALCRRIGVPKPQVNQWLDLGDGEPPIKPDFVWRAQRVIVETDGDKFHGTRQARERDPRRDQRAILAGWTPVRTTWRQLMRRPHELELTILKLVGRPAPPARSPR